MGVITYGAALQNEFKAYPPLVRVGSGFDLVTQNHWFDAVGTPSTQATVVPASGEASLDEKFEWVIKCVTDGDDEGWSQRYTYADEPRIKSGKHISAAIWLATTSGGGSGLAVALTNSDASTTAASVVETDGDFSLYVVEDHTCAGTYVELVVTKDSAGTFYAGGNITVMLGLDAIELPPRGLVFRYVEGTTVKTLTGLADEATWTDVDVTANTSALAAIAQMTAFILDSTSGDVFALHTRRNGTSETADENTVRCKIQVTSQVSSTMFSMVLDDGQVFEYLFDREGGSGTLEFGVITLNGYWEWA